MNGEVAAASMEERLGLLRAHPDLGTRAKISPSSTDEQAGAGLDRLTSGEYSRLLDLNGAYREKFGFPFLYAVKGSDKFAILEALERRLSANREDEFEEALRQVYRIARFRLESVVRL
jgi:2-oxo-4-hydroxy-4-carboxy-5-ureidoimidazoline decarboxylase